MPRKRCNFDIYDIKKKKTRKCRKNNLYGKYCWIHKKKDDLGFNYGKCCFCGNDCNPCSQSCGKCARKLCFVLF